MGFFIKYSSSPSILKPLAPDSILIFADPNFTYNRFLRKKEFVIKSWIGFFSDFNVYDWGNIFNSSMCNEDSNGVFVMIFEVIDSDDEFKSLLASWSIFF